MRDLTEEELMLIAGGCFLPSEGGGEPWWQSAFSWLSNSLSALGSMLPGGLGTYISGFGTVAGNMSPHGDMIWQRASGFNDYVVNEMSNGGSPMNFEEWCAAQGN